MAISAPSPLREAHRLDNFRCSSPELTQWLLNRARKNQRDDASRCFVVCDAQQNVIGYYALAAGSVSREIAPGSVKRNMPEPIPVLVLGRLAVHTDYAGQGIGAGLLRDAMLRAAQASQEVGIRALLCHAIDEQAKGFYLRHGFVESPLQPMTVMLGMAHLREVLRSLGSK